VRRVVAVVAVALNLRIALAVVGPLIEDIRADTGMSSAVAGLLGTIPFVCMSVFAFAGAPLLRRLGLRRLISIALLLIVAGAAVRSAAAAPLVLLAGTLPVGIGIALAGFAVPVAIKQHFSGQSDAMSGVYLAALALGSAGASLAAAPLAEWFGWSIALGVLAVAFGLLGLAAWSAGEIDERRVPSPAGAPLLPRLTRTSLVLALIFGCQSFCYGALLTWLAAVYQDRGFSLHASAMLTALLMAMIAPAVLVMPRLSGGRDPRPWMAGCAAILAGGTLALAIAPEAAPALWVTMIASGSGALFLLTITVPLTLHDTAADVGDMMAWILGLGFLITALGPLVTGAVRDLAGGFAPAMVVLAAVAVLPAFLAYAGIES